MANTENLFRFISIRPANLERETGKLSMYVYKSETKSPFYNEIKKAVAVGANKEDLARIGEKFKKSPNYISSLTMKFPVMEIGDWITQNGRNTFKAGKFVTSIETIAGKTLPKIMTDNEFNSGYIHLIDSVLSDILTGAPVSEKEEKITAIKILYTLKSVGEKTLTLDDNEVIDNFFGRSTVIFPIMKATPIEAPEENPEVQDPLKEEKERERDRKKELLKNLEVAHREVSTMAKDEKFRYLPEENVSENARIKELENHINLLSSKCKDKEEVKNPIIESSVSSKIHPANSEFILSRKAYGLLSESTQKIMRDFHFDADHINPVQVVNRIENEINFIHTNTEADFAYNSMIPVGGALVEKQSFMSTYLGKPGSTTGGIGAILKKCESKAGIGDLLIVRQKLKAYELAEFAHAENALAGEMRERIHRRLDVTETITSTTTETETEKQRDLQSTERSEMQSEAEKIVEQKAHVDAGLQVSGSYGPSISFSASLNAGFSSSVQETQKKSTAYSREVTEKTSEKVRSKVTEEFRRRVLAEIEETNTHRIDNTAAGAKHVRGIYRWLNKIYDAQIYNYGKRMMYEFVIPEPAAYYLYATIENPPADTELIKPSLPTYPITGSSPLKPIHLTRANYADYVSKYNVTNAPEPPAAFTVKTYFDKQDGNDNQNFGRASAIALPSGYEGYAVAISFDSVFEQGHSHSARIMVGAVNIDRNYWGTDYRTFPRRYRDEISVTIEMMQQRSFAIGIDVFCSLTEEAFAKWQLKMYDAIMQAYLDQKSIYDSKMEQKEIQKGVEIEGRNPIVNRRIEKEELKKLVIMILTNNPNLNINSYTASTEPIMDLAKVCSNGSYIRFFENAFEWENILYVFYPYFWGRHARWIRSIHLTDPDLDFAAFLKAGAARVQIPVRPGFEKAVAFFCQTGLIWEGNDVPLIGDDLYVPIIKEISESLGKLDDGVVYPEGAQPWEVTIPTSLIVLQDLTEIPNIRDMMTGNNINLLP